MRDFDPSIRKMLYVAAFYGVYLIKISGLSGVDRLSNLYR